MPEAKLEHPLSFITSSTSLRIICAAIVFVCLYFASSVVITLIFSILIAFVLDFGVRLLERLRVPRWLGSLVLVLLALGVVYLLIYVIYDRTGAFMRELPALEARIKQIVDHYENVLRQGTSSMGPQATENTLPVAVQQQPGWAQYLLHGIGSVYAFTVTVMFIPFLVFFMLTSKKHLYSSTVNLFPEEHRQQVEDILSSLSEMIRQYVFGNFLVAVVGMALIAPVFLTLHLHYALILAALAAVLDLIPYLGVLLATLPPLLVAMVQFNQATPIIIIAVTISVIHFISVDLLTPKLVGSRVRLNALAVTVAMMFWGWLWGAMGLILAVPITATIKSVCDNVPSLRAVGTWLGESGDESSTTELEGPQR